MANSWIYSTWLLEGSKWEEAPVTLAERRLLIYSSLAFLPSSPTFYISSFVFPGTFHTQFLVLGSVVRVIRRKTHSYSFHYPVHIFHFLLLIKHPLSEWKPLIFYPSYSGRTVSQRFKFPLVWGCRHVVWAWLGIVSYPPSFGD